MIVRKLTPEKRRDVDQFINFPFELYRDCPQWVPPLISSAKDTLNPHKHPFYRHSTAEFFVVESEGQTLGRLAMLENCNYNAYRGTQVAFFGYFDAVEDGEVARALFNTAFDWARARKLAVVIGPRGVIGVDGSVLVEGFEHRAALGIPYNFPYYDYLIKDSGFEKDADLLSGYRGVNPPLPERFYRIAEKVKARRGFWVKSFQSKKEIRRWIPRLLDAHHQAMSQLHTYYPPTPEETTWVIDTLLTIVEPKLIKLVMQGDKIIGFVLAYHDISAGLQKAKGRLWPTGWYHLWQARKQTNWLNVNAVGLLPSHRGLGATTLLYTELEKTVQEFNFEHVEMIQIHEENLASRSDLENIGVEWTKRHRHYRRRL